MCHCQLFLVPCTSPSVIRNFYGANFGVHLSPSFIIIDEHNVVFDALIYGFCDSHKARLYSFIFIVMCFQYIHHFRRFLNFRGRWIVNHVRWYQVFCSQQPQFWSAVIWSRVSKLISQLCQAFINIFLCLLLGLAHACVDLLRLCILALDPHSDPSCIIPRCKACFYSRGTVESVKVNLLSLC
jgi:hypothetical protein